MSDFDAVRAEIRANESTCDSLLTRYSELVHDPPLNTNEIEEQIEQLLTARQSLVRELSRLAYLPAATPTMQRQSERHAETLKDHQSTAKRLRTSISQERSRRSLLTSVRHDIQAHRATTNTNSPDTDPDSSNAYYSNEIRRVDHSRSLADTLLTSAYEARAELQRQQHVLGDVQRRMLSVLARVPGVNSLISKINTRQKRNSLVLATFIVLGVLFIVFVR